MKKVWFCLIAVCMLSTMSCTGGTSDKSAKTNVAPVVTPAAPQTDWEKYIVKYEKFLNEFIPVYQAYSKGDTNLKTKFEALNITNTLMDKEYGTIFSALTAADAVKFMEKYSPLNQKLMDAMMQ